MESLQLIARGRTAEVYAWGTDQVLKLFYPHFSREVVEFEQGKAQAVIAAGVNTPAVGEIVELEGRTGLVYQRVEAHSMLREIMRRPWAARRLATQMAELQVAMHACTAPNLPPQRRHLERKINGATPLPDPLRRAALEALAKLPEDTAVCHGDFHPDNILMTSQGPLIIDWVDASSGHPMGDVARTTLLTVKGTLPPGNPMAPLLNLLRRDFYRTYIRRYFSLSPYTPEQVQVWLPVVAAGRLDEGINEEQENLIRMVEQGLAATKDSPLETA